MTNILFSEIMYYFTLMMEVKGCSENSFYVYQTTLRHITEHKSLYIKDSLKIVKFTKVLRIQTQILPRKKDTSNKYGFFVKKCLGIAQRRNLRKLMNKINIDCR